MKKQGATQGDPEVHLVEHTSICFYRFCKFVNAEDIFGGTHEICLHGHVWDLNGCQQTQEENHLWEEGMSSGYLPRDVLAQELGKNVLL